MNTESPLMYPVALPAFRFVVDVGGKRQAAFMECTLPVIKWETEEVKEGGINTFTRYLPGRIQPATITFSNGVGNAELLEWYLSTLSGQFSRRTVTVSFLDLDRSKDTPAVVLTIEEAFPMQWTFEDLGVSKSTIAIQRMQLACGLIRVEVKGSYVS